MRENSNINTILIKYIFIHNIKIWFYFSIIRSKMQCIEIWKWKNWIFKIILFYETCKCLWINITSHTALVFIFRGVTKTAYHYVWSYTNVLFFDLQHSSKWITVATSRYTSKNNRDKYRKISSTIVAYYKQLLTHKCVWLISVTR